jgi:linoleate 10R-lipoxygenase
MKDSLTKQGLAERYTYDRPVATPIPKVLNTFTGIKYVFNDHHRFRTMYELNGLGSGYGFMLSFDDAER